MQFRNPQDHDLFQSLLNEGVFTLSEYQTWETPEEGEFMASALHNAEKIDSKRWVLALIRSLGVHRYNHPKTDLKLFSELSFDLETIKSIIYSYTYPLGIIRDNIWIGVTRLDTDKKEVIKAFEGFKSHYFCAIAPNEAREIEQQYRLFVKQTLKTMDLELELQESRAL